MANSTGYGPPASQRLYFNGDETKYEQWEVKMLAYMKIRKLKTAILPGPGVASADER